MSVSILFAVGSMFSAILSLVTYSPMAQKAMIVLSGILLAVAILLFIIDVALQPKEDTHEIKIPLRGPDGRFIKRK